MKTLVEMAKELGIEPKENLSAEEWARVTKLVGLRLLQETTGLPPEERHEQRRRRAPENLPQHVYDLQKHVNRQLPAGAPQKASQIMQKGKGEIGDIFVHVAHIGFQSFEDTPAIFHSATNNTGDKKERFTVDVDPSSPRFAEMIENMDRFITKYHAKFKVANAQHMNRTDIMNVYVPDEITPQMAQDLYRAVKPCLSEKYHDRLDGFEIFAGNTPIKGIKIGPELNEGETKEEKAEKYEMRSTIHGMQLSRDIPDEGLRACAERYLEPLISNSSLGDKAAALKIMDLMYYAIGKEGDNPFRMYAYDGSFYDKKLVLPPETLEAEKEAPKQSLFARFLGKKKSEKTEPAEKVYWNDAKNWSDVKVNTDDGVAFGHRIKLNGLTADQQKEMEERLTQLNIKYIKRQATQPGYGINPGDWTLRVVDPNSVRQLRSMVFHWATGPYERPVFMTKTEYAQYEKQQMNRRQKNY